MKYVVLSKQYLKEADRLKAHIEKLNEELKTANSINARDIRRRMRMMYEIMYELRCVGHRLREGCSDGWNSYTH